MRRHDAGLHALARSSCLRRLKVLDLSTGGWTDAGIGALVESAVVGGLNWLNLSCATLTVEGLRMAPDRSILVPTTHDEPPLRFRLYRELFAQARQMSAGDVTSLVRRLLTSAGV